jgi:hypothetical protein
MKSMKYLAIASAFALVAVGTSGTAFAGRVLGAASESGTAAAVARMNDNPATTHFRAPRQLYLYSGQIRKAPHDMGAGWGA